MSAVPARASLGEPLRSGCRDPSPIHAALCRTPFRSSSETRAVLSYPRCCRSSLHRPTESRRVSPPARSPVARNPAARPGCSRAWLLDSVRSLLRNTYWSDRRAALRNRLRTDRPTSASGIRITPACAPVRGPDTDTNGLSPPPQNLYPSTADILHHSLQRIRKWLGQRGALTGPAGDRDGCRHLC